MKPEHFALLSQIADGNYLPALHAPYTLLAYLHRHGLIQYGGPNVTLTSEGKRVLAAQKEQSNG